jgi:hypothetical protein
LQKKHFFLQNISNWIIEHLHSSEGRFIKLLPVMLIVVIKTLESVYWHEALPLTITTLDECRNIGYVFSLVYPSDNSSSVLSIKTAPTSALISKSVIHLRSIFCAHPWSKAIVSENMMTVCQELFLNFLDSLWRILQNMAPINYSSGSHVIADYNVAI